MTSKEALIARLRESANGGWGGIETHRDAERLEKFVRKMLANYSAVLGLSEGDILRKLEGKRNYWSMNFYRFVVKEDFLNNPVVHEIFMPLELAGAGSGDAVD